MTRSQIHKEYWDKFGDHECYECKAILDFFDEHILEVLRDVANDEQIVDLEYE